MTAPRRFGRLGAGTAALAALIVVSAGASGLVVHGLDGQQTASTSTTSSTANAASTPVSAVTTVLAKIEPSVVDINTTIVESTGNGPGGGTATGAGAGTGIVITSTGDIVTNAHVIANAASITVTLADGSTHAATVVNTDTTKDLAIVAIQGVTGLTPATFANSTSVAVGDSVIAVGNALGYGGSPTVTEGIISATNRSLQDTSSDLTGLLQTDAALNPGNSSGPLVDGGGDVIGINDAIATGTTTEPAQNVGFAIPSNVVTAYIAGVVQTSS